MDSFIRIALVILILFGGVAPGGLPVPSGAATHQDSSKERSTPHPHGSVPVAPQYTDAKAWPGLWTDAPMIARGKQIYSEKCAICHGDRGDGRVEAAAACA